MISTAIHGIKGVWSVHREGQPLVEGTAVYQYPYHWACEVHGPWRPWFPGPLPCNEIQAVLAMEATPYLPREKATLCPELS